MNAPNVLVFVSNNKKIPCFQLREDFDSGNIHEIHSDASPHDVAALLKEFLRELPEPLLCRSLYQGFVGTQSKAIRIL